MTISDIEGLSRLDTGEDTGLDAADMGEDSELRTPFAELTRRSGDGDFSPAPEARMRTPESTEKPIEPLRQQAEPDAWSFVGAEPNSARARNHQQQHLGTDGEPLMASRPAQIADEVFWAIHNQVGFKFPPGSTASVPLHTHMEDVTWPAASAEFRMPQTHPLSQLPLYVWALADGHGGHEAGRWFIERVGPAVLRLLRSRDWDFEGAAQRRDFEGAAAALYTRLDAEYCARKMEEFERWGRGGKVGPRPLDDGCTMVVNALYRGYAVNLNLGDSRTLIARRLSSPRPHAVFEGDGGEDVGPFEPSPLGESTSASAPRRFRAAPDAAQWHPLFMSTDHTPNHPARAAQIHASGGLFTDSAGNMYLADGVVAPELHPAKYEELEYCRIRRAPHFASAQMSVPLRTTLNLAGTLGDLNFKLAPALLSPVPDVRFVRMEPGFEYLVVMATDGLWDHLDEQGSPYAQAKSILRFFAQRSKAGISGAAEHGKDARHTLMERLTEALCMRLGNGAVFSQEPRRYDDVTVMAGLFPFC